MNNPNCAWLASLVWHRKSVLLLFIALALSILSGCNRRSSTAADSANPGERVFEVRGVVREIASSRDKAAILHEDIPGFMSSMEMDFTVRNPRELDGISVGDTITFRLHVTVDSHWIDTLRRQDRAQPDSGPVPATNRPPPLAELKPGDVLPDQVFTSETGGKVRLSDFRGNAVAFTFFFTRCPLPDFCPRMNHHFSEARALLLKRLNVSPNWQFLCLSFDAEFDQPSVLAGYAKTIRGENAYRWLFASASPEVLAGLAPLLGLKVAREGAGFSHNLRTVVLDPQGRLYRQFNGNQWTPEELADAVAEAVIHR